MKKYWRAHLFICYFFFVSFYYLLHGLSFSFWRWRNELIVLSFCDYNDIHKGSSYRYSWWLAAAFALCWLCCLEHVMTCVLAADLVLLEFNFNWHAFFHVSQKSSHIVFFWFVCWLFGKACFSGIVYFFFVSWCCLHSPCSLQLNLNHVNWWIHSI